MPEIACILTSKRKLLKSLICGQSDAFSFYDFSALACRVIVRQLRHCADLAFAKNIQNHEGMMCRLGSCLHAFQW